VVRALVSGADSLEFKTQLMNRIFHNFLAFSREWLPGCHQSWEGERGEKEKWHPHLSYTSAGAGGESAL